MTVLFISIPLSDEESDIDVRDRGMLYYRLLKQNVELAKRVICGQSSRLVAQKNTVIPRVSIYMYLFYAHLLNRFKKVITWVLTIQIL